MLSPKYLQPDIVKLAEDGFRGSHLSHRAMVRCVPRPVALLMALLAGIRSHEPVLVNHHRTVHRLVDFNFGPGRFDNFRIGRTCRRPDDGNTGEDEEYSRCD